MRFDEGRLHAALQHEAALRRLARGLLRDPAAADEAAQHAVLQAASSERTSGAGLWPFLVTTLRNHAKNLHKLAQRRTRHETAAARRDTVAPADDLLAREQLRRRVADAVLALDEPYRTTVWLRWFENVSTSAIAARLGVPGATVRTRLQRAHAQLRQRLDADFGDRRWATLVALPLAAVASSTLLGVSVMTKKWFVVGAAVAIVASAFTVPWLANDDALPADVANEGVVVATAPLHEPTAATTTDRERTANATANDVAPPVRAPNVRIVHADGQPAIALEVRWWTAANRPEWTERIDPGKVRTNWPRGMGPGAFRQPWPIGDLRTSSTGDVAVPTNDAAPAAIAVRLGDGLFFATTWNGERTIALPPLARLDLAVSGAPANARWRGGCFAAFCEGDDEDLNHGYARLNVETSSGAGVVRWDRLRFASDTPQAEVVVLAGRPCAIEAEGIGFQIEPSVAFSVAPGAVTFRAGERVPQLVVQVVAGDGSDAARSGRVWVVDESGSNSEELVAGRASLDRRTDAGRRDVLCMLADGSTLRGVAPVDEPDQDRTLRLSLANVEPPVRVACEGGFDATLDAVWIDVGGQFVASERTDLLPPQRAGAFFVVDGELRLAGQDAGWRGGFAVTGNGRVATFARGVGGALVRATWLADAKRTIDVPAMSREFGDLPAFTAALELEAQRDDGTTQWILLRFFRRLVATDHPQRLEAWPLQLPTAWRARMTFRGGPTDQKQAMLEQRLLH